MVATTRRQTVLRKLITCAATAILLVPLTIARAIDVAGHTSAPTADLVIVVR